MHDPKYIFKIQNNSKKFCSMNTVNDGVFNANFAQNNKCVKVKRLNRKFQQIQTSPIGVKPRQQ